MLALTREQIRAIDSHAIETLGIPGLMLMENAGRGATDAFEAWAGGVEDKPVAIVAGGGNNGGDGFVIARHLHIRAAQVTVFVVAPHDKISGDAETNLQAALALGLDVRDVREDIAGLGDKLKQYEFTVDAVGGTGIKGALRGTMAEVVEQIIASGTDVLAVDIPTGLDCDTGAAEGPAVKARLTATFAANKVGFAKEGASAYTGQVTVCDIGIPAEQLHRKLAGGA
jgi:NAD(P)H-hydrate epimerase